MGDWKTEETICNKLEILNSNINDSIIGNWYKHTNKKIKKKKRGFPGGAMVENLPANAGDTGSSPGLGRSHMPRSN